MNKTAERFFSVGLKLFLVVFPFQTVYIIQERFSEGVKWEYGTLVLYASECLLWLVVGLFLLSQWQGMRSHLASFQQMAKEKKLVIISSVLFLLYCGMTAIWAQEPSVALQQWRFLVEAALLFLMIFFGPVPVSSFITWFLIGSFVQASLGIYQFLTQTVSSSVLLGFSSHPAFQRGTSIIAGDEIGRWVRAYGSFPHPNVFGGYLFVSLVCVSLLLLYCSSSLRRIEHVLLIALIPIFTTAILFTLSRSAIIATVIWMGGIAVYGMIKKSRIHIAIAASVLLTACIIGVFIAPLLQSRLSQKDIHEVQSVDERVSGYWEAIGVFRKHPILGVGLGNVTIAEYTLFADWPLWQYQPPHVAFLDFSVETGTLGILLVLTTLFYGWMVFKKDLMNTFPLLLFLVSFGVLSLFDHYLYSLLIGLFISAFGWGIMLRLSCSHDVHILSTLNSLDLKNSDNKPR